MKRSAIATIILLFSCTKSDPESCFLIMEKFTTTLGGFTSSSSTIFYYNANGQPSSRKSGLESFSYVHNSEGQLIKASGDFLEQFFYYNTIGQPVRDSAYSTSSLGPPFWTITNYTYNSTGQLTQVTECNASAADPACNIHRSFEFFYPNSNTKDYTSYVWKEGDAIAITMFIEYDVHPIRDEFRMAWLPLPAQTDHFPKKIIENGGEISYTYEFNSIGNPTTMHREENGSNSGYQEYTYMCR